MSGMLSLAGMHGLGDNIRSRAIVRQLSPRYDRIYFHTPWPCVFHDLLSKLVIVPARSSLRTQAKNEAREAAKYYRGSIHGYGLRTVRINYPIPVTQAVGSMLGAMMSVTGCDHRTADFTLPVPDNWFRVALAGILAPVVSARKPVLVYRPLVMRTEWGGCASRNPDFSAYAALLRAIRDSFFLVSVADLVPNKEWIVSELVEADLEFHHGELQFEQLAALWQYAALVFCSPGFGVVLGQAVGTPSVCVFGGHECSKFYDGGLNAGPTLLIDPIHPCSCFSNTHACDKRIDLDAATAKLLSFASAAINAKAATMDSVKEAVA